MMSKLSKEKQTQLALIAFGTVAVAALIWYFFVSIPSAGLQKLQQDIFDLEEKTRRAEFRIRRASTVASELAALEKQIGEVETHMIPYEQLNGKKWLLDTLTRFIQTNEHEVIPTRLSNDPVTGNEFVTLPKFAYSGALYEVELRAFYHDFGRFLADLETSFPYLRIHNLQLAPIATPSAVAGPSADLPDELLNSVDREQLRVSMKLVVLFKPPDIP